MGKNKNLHQAKKAKNDEFYTLYEDIEKELKHYIHHLNNKTIYCNCDNPNDSNFFKYFVDNFSQLNLKRVIATSYNKDGKGLMGVYDGHDIIITELNGDGDFRSNESIEILNDADIIITNPPFSLFREYVAQLIEYNKKFIIIGNGNAVTYKEIFPLIKENKLWLGAGKGMGGKAMEFIVDEKLYDAKKGTVNRIENGKCYVGVMMCTWFTNILPDNNTKPYEILYKKYNPEEYPKYDNYDAINVDKVRDIPFDYYGVIGVPILFLDKWAPKIKISEEEQVTTNDFEIIGITENNKTCSNKDVLDLMLPNCEKYDRPYINNKRMYARILIQRIIK